MKIIEWIKEIPGLFDWYFRLTPLKRIQLNYIVLITVIIFFAYQNDAQHRTNYQTLSDRMDSVNNGRTKEQENYTKKLEFYTDKFNNLLEILIRQDKEIKEIKKEI
jgi:hypothetical protein